MSEPVVADPAAARRESPWSGRGSSSVVRRPAFLAGTAIAAYGVFQLAGQYEPVLFLHDSEFVLTAATAMSVGAATSAVGAGRVLHAARSDLVAYLRTLAWPLLVAVAYLALSIVGLKAIGGIGRPDLAETIAVPLEVAAATTIGLAVGAVAGRLPRWVTGAGAAVLAATLAVVGIGLAGSGPWSGLEGRANGHCVTRGEVQYCLYEPYDSYISRWQEVVEPVLAAAPAHVAAGPWRVVQDDDEDWIHGTLATTGRAWGRGVGVAYARAGIAVQVGDVLTGATRDAPCPGEALRGRVVTALWLAGQAGRDVRDYLASDDTFADAITGSQMAATPPVAGSLEERHAAALLLDADADDVRSYVHANWDSLTGEPCASASELLERFTP